VLDFLARWVDAYASASLLVQGGVVLGLSVFVGAVLVLVVALLPCDYFATTNMTASAASWWRRHPVVRFGLILVKNLFGIAIFALGMLMLVGPGPGIVVLALGVSLLDVPGKRSLERQLLRRPGVLHMLNDVRTRLRRAPFVLDPE